MRRGETLARKTIGQFLSERREPVLLFSLSVMADKEARRRRKGELFASLYDYESLLPAGWETAWMNHTGSRLQDAALYAVRAGVCTEGGLRRVHPVPGAFDAAADVFVRRGPPPEARCFVLGGDPET